MSSKIHFHTEGIKFKATSTPALKKWLLQVAKMEGNSINEINYIFCSDEYLLTINRDFLEHDYYTDIITFDNSEVEGEIEGDIFISIDRIKENAIQFEEEFESEFKRVMVHGLLHLLGYKDKTTSQKKEMRSKEDYYLNLPAQK